MISRAVLVVASSSSSLALRARSFSTSISAAERFGRFAELRASPNPARAPASRALVHSITCEEYRPSRRRIAPFSPFGDCSYSATIRRLYSAVNLRRDGRGDGPGSDRGPPSPAPPAVGCHWTHTSGSPITPPHRTPHLGCLTRGWQRGLPRGLGVEKAGAAVGRGEGRRGRAPRRRPGRGGVGVLTARVGPHPGGPGCRLPERDERPVTQPPPVLVIALIPTDRADRGRRRSTSPVPSASCTAAASSPATVRNHRCPTCPLIRATRSPRPAARQPRPATRQPALANR